MLKKYLLLLGFVFLASHSFGQVMSKGSLLQKEIELKETPIEDIRNVLYLFTNAEIDSLDIDVITFKKEFLAVRLLGVLVKNKLKKMNPTYADVLEDIKEFKKNKDYPNILKKVLKHKDLNSRPWRVENWKTDSTFMSVHLEYSAELLEQVYPVLLSSSGEYENYEMARKAIAEKIKTKGRQERFEKKEAFRDETNVGYNKHLLKAKNNGKPLLLYFTGRTCVNCRKMEENIFSDEVIYKILIEKFNLVSLYVDDSESIEGSSFKVYNSQGDQLKTVGAYNLDIEISEFESNTQPLLVAIDAKRNLLGKILYTNSTEEFMKFLKMVLYKNDLN